MEFLCLFLKSRLAGKLAVVSQNVGCFLRLHYLGETTNSALPLDRFSGYPNKKNYQKEVQSKFLKTAGGTKAIYYYCLHIKQRCLYWGGEFGKFDVLGTRRTICNKTPKVVSVGCVGLWKHNSVLSEFGKIRETGKMCHVMSIDE